MTKQEMFDHQCAHLAKQQCRAIDPVTGNCQYLNDGGHMCIVGCLFDAGELKQFGVSGFRIGGLFASGLRPFFREHVEYLKDSQSVHDSADQGFDPFREDLRNLATRHGLNPEAAEQIQVWHG